MSNIDNSFWIRNSGVIAIVTAAGAFGLELADKKISEAELKRYKKSYLRLSHREYVRKPITSLTVLKYSNRALLALLAITATVSAMNTFEKNYLGMKDKFKSTAEYWLLGFGSLSVTSGLIWAYLANKAWKTFSSSVAENYSTTLLALKTKADRLHNWSVIAGKGFAIFGALAALAGLYLFERQHEDYGPSHRHQPKPQPQK
jgi:hypothetical protein